MGNQQISLVGTTELRGAFPIAHHPDRASYREHCLIKQYSLEKQEYLHRLATELGDVTLKLIC